MIKKQPIYWTFETEDGELLAGWCERTKKRLIEERTWFLDDDEVKNWKPVKVQLVKVQS